MGIWIKSQNKKAIHLIQSFILNDIKNSISYESVYCIVTGITSFGVQYQLGEYESEEKALDVLESIQKHIAMLEHNKMCINSPCEQYNYDNFLFEMPEK